MSIPRLAAERRRVGHRPLARVPRRHGHAVHVLGPERVDGHGRHQRGVDPARQPDDGVGEAVLSRGSRACPSTSASYTSAIDRSSDRSPLGVAPRRSAPPGARSARPRCRLPRTGPPRERRRPRGSSRRVVGAVLDVEIDEQHLLLELRRRGHERPVARPRPWRRRRRPARPARRPGSRRRWRTRSRRPVRRRTDSRSSPAAPRVGRGVEVDQQPGAAPPPVRHRPVGEPHVLADGDADGHPGHDEPSGPGPSRARTTAARRRPRSWGGSACTYRPTTSPPDAQRGGVEQPARSASVSDDTRRPRRTSPVGGRDRANGRQVVGARTPAGRAGPRAGSRSRPAREDGQVGTPALGGGQGIQDAGRRCRPGRRPPC